jgi:hypothetical protein
MKVSSGIHHSVPTPTSDPPWIIDTKSTNLANPTNLLQTAGLIHPAEYKVDTVSLRPGWFLRNKILKLAARIPHRIVFFSVAIQITLPGKSTQIVELQSAPAIRANDLQIKVYEMAVIDRITLGVADSMRVVTGRARRLLILYVFFVLRKTLVPQYTLPAVAFVAQGVG